MSQTNENGGPSCPLGFICADDGRIESCEVIRNRARDFFLFGDVHAGSYCPSNSSVYQHCPAGYYCPDPSTMIICPEGKFCPDKTALPEIDCENCDEGSSELQRQTYGYIILTILCVAAAVFIAAVLVRRYNKELWGKLHDLKDRRMTSQRAAAIKKMEQERVERIRPRLEVIADRVKTLREKRVAEAVDATARGLESSSAGTPPSPAGHAEKVGDTEEQLQGKHPTGPLDQSDRSVDTEDILFVDYDGNLTFDAEALFEEVDTDISGDLSYSELNKILELNHLQLNEFVTTMNRMAGVSSESTTVSKEVFVQYFLDVLERSSNFGPTKEEAAKLFDELALEVGTNKNGEIKPGEFYHSRLTNFMSDTQINDMIKKFRREKEESSHRSSTRSDGRRSTRHNVLEWNEFRRGISKEEFVDLYPAILNEVSTYPDDVESLRKDASEMLEDETAVDIAFQDLSLTVNVRGEPVYVVDNVTGRIKASTMTALMGGSGAGKTSLLNALCGRAFYGRVTGIIKVNGQNASIEEIKGSVGFVPQDDIVFAELTVRENFMYSGRFQLPAGTPVEDIEDLADATVAKLGLSRVANNIVGDVSRRGVSGGERKRVNIGVELMSKPRILFLDEPTSGLDASSAMLVMQCLKRLVEKQGVTVCSVIHQPRKFIYDLFDSLILLGVGGKMVYHGPTDAAAQYFSNLRYTLPPGESVADWLIDISSGRLEPEDKPLAETRHSTLTKSSMSLVSASITGAPPSSGNISNRPVSRRRSTQTQDALVRIQGPSANKAEKAAERAAFARESLYRHWNTYFASIYGTEKERYDPPDPYALPERTERPSFFRQLLIQMERNVLMLRRNAFSKFIDTVLIVGAVLLISGLEGVTEVTSSYIPDVSFDTLASDDPTDLVGALPELFRYAWSRSSKLQEYSMKLGVIVSVLVGLTATKIITDKRLEFFREAGSGYDVNAYFLAVNVTSTIEHGIQIVLSAASAFWLRNSISDWKFYFLNFLMLAWLCVSWALFLPLLVPPKNVVLVVGFFMAFFGLLCSGGLSPVQYEDLYGDNPVLAVFSGFVSPTRYFIEGMAVSEQRCLPPQSGFTVVQSEAVNFPMHLNSFSLLHLAQNDSDVTDRSCSGWYWGVLPALFVGLTVRVTAAATMHISGRSKQSKRPLIEDMRDEFRKPWREQINSHSVNFTVALVVIIIVFLFSLSCWFILRET